MLKENVDILKTIQIADLVFFDKHTAEVFKHILYSTFIEIPSKYVTKNKCSAVWYTRCVGRHPFKTTLLNQRKAINFKLV